MLVRLAKPAPRVAG